MSYRVRSRAAAAISVIASLFTIGCVGPLITSHKVVVPTEPGEFEKYNLDGASYFLPRGVVDITISRDKDGNHSMTVSNVTFLPDPNHFYRIDYNDSIFSTDVVTIQTTSTGLLLSVATKTTDEAGALVKKVVELATEAAKAAVIALREPPGLEPKPFKITLTIDPTDPKQKELVNKTLGSKGGNLSFSVSPLSSILVDKTNKMKCLSGICYRPAIPYLLKLSDSDTVVAQTLVLLPNDAIIASIDVNRRAFIANTTNITFSNGMLTKLELDKPSEAVGFMGIPIDVAKAIVSIPSAIFDFKVTLITGETRLIAAQNANLSAQAALIATQKKLLDAQTEALEQLMAR